MCFVWVAHAKYIMPTANAWLQPTTNLAALESPLHALAFCPCFYTLLIHFLLGLSTFELYAEVVRVLR